MSTQTYRLPDFLSLLSAKNSGRIINPHFQKAEASYRAWIQNSLTGDPAKIAEESDGLLFTALFWPHASYEWLLALAIWSTLGFVFDDLLDHFSKEEAPVLVRSWVDSLHGDAKPTVPRHPLMTLIQKDIIPSMRTTLGSHWPRFVADNENWLLAMVQEGGDREAHLNTSDIQSYFNVRRAGVGAFVASTMTRSSRSLDIPDNVLAHPAVQEMEHAILDAMIITNDVYSYGKEYKVDKGFSNILTVILNDEKTSHLDLQGALDHSGMLAEASLERFRGCVRDLPSFDSEIDACLASYAEALVEAAVGNVNWHRVSRRYNVFENEEDRENNIVRWVL